MYLTRLFFFKPTTFISLPNDNPLLSQVSAYGYITEGYQKYSDHYYDKERKRLIFYTNHDFDLERRVWKQLHDANIMKLYQRTWWKQIMNSWLELVILL